MGLLTNQYVSESYQGLLNLANPNTGLTSTLQTVTDGLGGTSPLQISQTQVNISGSLTINGSPVVTTDTGSLMKTGSVAGSILTFTKGDGSTFDLSVTSSLPAGVVSGSQQIIDLGFLETGSFNSYTSSNDSKVNSLIASTGSYATTSSLTSLSQSIATTDLGQDGRLNSLESATGSLQNQINQKLDSGSFNSYTSSNDAKVTSLESKTGSYATTGSNDFVGQQNINGDVNVTGSLNVTGEITALSASITYLETIYQTSSVIFSSGSNILGDEAGDTQTLFGTVRLPNGPLVVTGSATVSGASTFGGNVLVSGSNAITLRVSSSLANGGITTISPLNVVASSGSYASTLGKTSVVNVDSTGAPTTIRYVGIAANPSLLGAPSVVGVTSPSILGMNASSQPEALISFQHRGAYTDGRISILKNTDLTGSLTVTNGITGSLEGTASYATNALSSSHSVNSDTSISSSFAQNAISSSHAINADTSSYINNSTLEQNLTINGMLNVTGAFTASGLIYPSADNGERSFIQSDGNGNLSLQYVESMIEPIYNGEATTLTKGTPVYVSGSQGANPIVYAADASDPNKMPAIYIVDENLGSGQTGIGLLLGKIEGVDTTGFPAGTEIFVGSGGGFTDTRPTGSGIVQTLGIVTKEGNGGQGIVLNPGPANLPNIQEGYVWVGNSNSYPTAVSTSSFIEDLSSYATTGSNNFVGNQTITGSLSVRSGSVSSISNNTSIIIENYVTNSLGGQANIIKGWGDNPNPAGPGAVQTNYTGSINITGSNNIVSLPQLRATGFGGPGNAGHQGYISGSDNMIMSNFAGIYLNTGSQLFPKTQNNILGQGSSITMNFTTSSLAGGHPIVTNNFIQGGTVQLNSNSGSITSFGTNIINGGAVFSTQNFTTNTRTLITQNNINNSVTLNHISSSITYQSNISNAAVTVNNHVSSSGIANNFVSVANNVFLGGSNNTGHFIYTSGSQSSNSQRFITDNLIGGRSTFISSSFVGSNNSNLMSSLIYGQALFVSGNHPTTNGGSAFLGRYNDTATGLHLAQDIVFAVGTGTSSANRRTGLYVTSGSLVGVSGSLAVKGTTTLSGSSPLQVGTSNSVGKINTLGGSNWLYRNTDDYNTIIGNVAGIDNGFFAGSEKNMVLNGFFSPFATGSNNVIIQGAGDDFISGSGNIFIGSHGSHAGGSNNILLGATSYSSGSIFNDKFELGTLSTSRIFHKQGTDPLQIGDDTQVTGSVSISNVMNLKPLDPLPTGNIGDLAVSSSNQLYFYNGAWTLIA